MYNVLNFSLKELIAKLNNTETYENVLIDIFILFLENKIEQHDSLRIFIEMSKLCDHTLTNGSESCKSFKTRHRKIL